MKHSLKVVVENKKAPAPMKAPELGFSGLDDALIHKHCQRFTE
jgi:hypothetical protein